jgi:excisionase family DNA binding protein
MSMPGSLLNAHQVARWLNVKVATVYAAADAGRIPSVRLWEGRKRALLRFRSEDIARLIAEGIDRRDRSTLSPTEPADERVRARHPRRAEGS